MEPTTPTTVLVADDDEDILELVRFRLEHDGHRVLVARDGLAALELARRERPDVCVLDVMMPKLTGLELARRLRAEAETAGTRIVLLTARVQDADVDAGFDAGADDYVKKPFSPGELSRRVRAQLAR